MEYLRKITLCRLTPRVQDDRIYLSLVPYASYRIDPHENSMATHTRSRRFSFEYNVTATRVFRRYMYLLCGYCFGFVCFGIVFIENG